ncbi:MAG: 16S rRNA (cytosine(1402)-N(4))-methyltransferase RsmH [Candidatus Moranbacteria bacterium]|nr:16S rRNA (cytosine(1402)-N(4))-methyltransferase RsmH [Candidatus Moranbacteria bacterium]MDD3964791.1 16S rRNA (cytosine(1402)-N(4))-methyltransferase RsmH [Candidatus Moranbacteria bacterium]
MEEVKHIPVLLQEVVDGLSLHPGDIVVDATFGGGGYTKEILTRILPGGRVIAIDTDLSTLESFRKRVKEDVFLSQRLEKEELVLVHSNYSALESVLENQGIERIDALVADLGFSSDQIEASERGLSFMLDGPLDMRLNRETGITAGEIVNTFSLEALEKILRDFGDESECRRIAKALVKEREEKPFTTTDELREMIERVYPRGKRYKMKIHPATKTFQALRIAVNEEEKHLDEFLKQSGNRMKKGGRIAIVTFHSGEDRRVKQFWKEQAEGCVCPPGFPVCRCGNMPKVKILTKKPIIPTDEEIKKNPRARSAKLRIAEKI